MEKKLPYQWPPLESDPEILTQYMQKLGMSPDWVLSEVIGLEPDFLAMVPATSVAFILAYAAESAGAASKKDKPIPLPIVDFYMWQTSNLDNACGLIACLHAVLNNLEKVPIVPASPLQQFWLKACKQTPEERAATLDSFTAIQEAHHKCGLEGQSHYVAKEEDVTYHFICFTRNKPGQLVELDGIAGDPIKIKGKFAT